ncbi:ankyrin repeat [Fusarium coicis]|nr:ankyrin repeat [Fusarium coicis]
MPFEEKLKKWKKIFHHHKEEDASKSPIHGQSEEQESSLSINTRSSHVATIEKSGIAPPIDAIAPREAPDQEPLAAKESGNSIRQLWAVAYKSLREEGDSPVQAFEDQIRRSLPDIDDRTSSDENVKDWISKVVQNQMDQVKRDSLKLRFGTVEVEAQDVVKSVLAVVDWSKDYVSKALSSNPTASIAWGGVTLLLPSTSSDPMPASHAEYRRALEMLYQEVLRFQMVCYGYYSHKSVSRFVLDSVKHHGWDELLEKVKYRETEFDKVSQSWRDKIGERESKSFLWLNGKAGSGKSILSSSVIKYLKIKYENDPEAALAYYFFSFGNVEQQKLSAMLSSLVRQLCASRPDTPQPIKRFEDYMARGERPDIETLEVALMSAVSGFSAAFIVIDALDECPVLDGERPKLLSCLRRIITAMPDNLHIFCTSRDEPDIHMAIDKLLDAPSKAAIDLAENQLGLGRDMRLYIDSVLGAETYCWWSDDVMAKAKDILITRADGMFQYLVCQFEVLQYLDSEASVLSALNDLPTGLDETYNRLLLGLNSKSKLQILGSLKWLALSRRPLHLKELAEIFIFRPETDTMIHKTERLFDPKAVLKHFPSLVTTETKDEWNDETRRRENNTYVRLAHFTVKEYLISERIEKSKAKQFYFTEANAHLHIAHCCVSYHLYQSVENTGDDVELPLKTYAARNWELHLELVPRELWTNEVIQLAELALSMRTKSLRDILFNGQLRDRWYAYKNRVDNLMQRPYCYTAAIGSLELTKLLLKKGSRTRRFLIREDLDLALREAAEEGRIEIVRFLLNERADSSKITSRALQAAANHGHIAVIKLLLEKGADIDARDDRFGSALEAAAKGFNLTALRMLCLSGPMQS